MALGVAAVHTAEAAPAVSAMAAFRNSHPVATVFANVGILALVLGIGTISLAVLSKGPNDL